MKIENKNNFDIQDVGKTLDEAQQDKVLPQAKNIRINGVSIDLSDYTLILKRYSKNVKEKTLIDLSCVQSTKVVRIAKPTFLILAIVSLVLGLGATYPIYIYYKLFCLIAAGLGVALGILFFILYAVSKKIMININLSNGKTIKFQSKEVKAFDKFNNFFDELFYNKHNN